MTPTPSSLRTFFVLLLIFASQPLTAQRNSLPLFVDPGRSLVYPVKVVCTTTERQIQLPIVTSALGQQVPGVREERSRTFLNLLNPLPTAVTFTVRAVKPRQGTADSFVFDTVSETLGPLQARALDCADFIGLQQNNPPPGVLPATEGFIVLDTPSQLQVAAVYTQALVKEAAVEDQTFQGVASSLKNVFVGPGTEVPTLELAPLTPLNPEPLASTGGGSKAKHLPMGGDGLAIGGQTAVPIEVIPDPANQVSAAAMGIGIGFGVGQGIGIGIGAGAGIDVEYIEPIVVPRRLVSLSQNP